MEYIGVLWSRYLVHVADVLLVSFLFYQLLLQIQGTRAVQIAVGIAIIAGLTVLAQLLGFPALSWLLRKFWLAGILVIAVVFQPELRSGLARLGAKTAGRFNTHQEIYVVNELVAAVKEASRRQMGMLLAIERDTGLRDFIESGTAINGEVSRELLLTIFQPPSALHDGGVIIQGNRIAAAGCIFPVSQDTALSRLLGTRHRAAVGITEVSDAWTVCVSEETGTISIASNGRLMSPINADDLRQDLLHLFQASSPEETKADAV